MVYSIILTKRPACAVMPREYYLAKCGEHRVVVPIHDDCLDYIFGFNFTDGLRLSIFWAPEGRIWGSLWNHDDPSDALNGIVECELSANSEL